MVNKASAFNYIIPAKVVKIVDLNKANSTNTTICTSQIIFENRLYVPIKKYSGIYTKYF